MQGKEPANLYEAVIALENFKTRHPADPPQITLTQEQQAQLMAGIEAAIRPDKERNGQA